MLTKLVLILSMETASMEMTFSILYFIKKSSAESQKWSITEELFNYMYQKDVWQHWDWKDHRTVLE